MEPTVQREEPLQYDTLQGEASLRRFSELLDRSFLVPAGAHFLDDFPVWDDRHAMAERLRIGAFTPSGELAGCAAARIAELKTPGGLLKVALIGAVASDPKFRGKGLASSLVDMLSMWSQEHGAALAALWGTELLLYGRLGFVPCGAQALVPLASLVQSGTLPAEVYGRGWTDGIFDCLRSRKNGLQILKEDRPWIAAHKNVSWYFVGPAEKPVAYAGVGRGIDMQEIVHEWGGESEVLRSLLQRILVEHPEAQLLISPLLHKEYAQLVAPQHLCLAKVFDPLALQRAFPARKSEDPLPLWFWGLDSA